MNNKGQSLNRLQRDEHGRLTWEVRHDGIVMESGVFDGVNTFRHICEIKCRGCRVYLGGRELVNFDWIRDTFVNRRSAQLTREKVIRASGFTLE